MARGPLTDAKPRSLPVCKPVGMPKQRARSCALDWLFLEHAPHALATVGRSADRDKGGVRANNSV